MGLDGTPATHDTDAEQQRSWSADCIVYPKNLFPGRSKASSTDLGSAGLGLGGFKHVEVFVPATAHHPAEGVVPTSELKGSFRGHPPMRQRTRFRAWRSHSWGGGANSVKRPSLKAPCTSSY